MNALRAGSPGPGEYRFESKTQESDGDLRHLRGNVHIESIDKKMDADEVDYNEDTGDVEAWGNVRYENFLDGTKLECDHAKYNVNSETGIFYDVRGTSETKIVARPGLLTTNNPFYFEGKWGEGKGKYIVHDGYVTDCKVPKPWWRLTAPKFDIFRTTARSHTMPSFGSSGFLSFTSRLYHKSLKKLPAPKRIPHAQHRAQPLYGEIFGLAYYWAISRSMTRFIELNISRFADLPATWNFAEK